MDNQWMDESLPCEVRAHGRVIRYRCTGVGRPLLLLHSGTPRPPGWDELLGALAERYRLIVPEPPAPDVDVAAWLHAFLEGLGATAVRVLAADRFCLPALELVRDASDQVARLVLLPSGGGRERAVAGADETALADPRVPLLVVREGDGADGFLDEVTRFLEAPDTAAIDA